MTKPEERRPAPEEQEAKEGEELAGVDEQPQPGLAEEEPEKEPIAEQRPEVLLTRAYTAEELKGREVEGLLGEDLGEIEDVIIGRNGQVEFVVVAYGGFLGLGENLVAVPYSALRPGPLEDSFVVGFTKEKLEQAPAFERGKWPDFYTEAWRGEVRGYYKE
jgi:sporulation protein YlmC with PRC-barrel domain